MKKRVISAIVALAIIVPLLIIGGLPLYIGIGILSLLAYKEIVTLKESHHRLPDLMKVLGAFSLVFVTFSRFAGYSLITGISYAGLGTLLILMLSPTIYYDEDTYTTKDAFYMIGSILMVGLLFNSIILVYNLNKMYLIYLILITTMNDTFAMVMGKLIGKHKLIPKVSPNKTIEGSTSGLIIGTFIATLFFMNVISSDVNSILIVLITLILGVVGQVGDLVFSKIKRENKIKDFSNIMPGHGGILDRLDSLAFVLFAFMVIIRYL
ncbi:MAG: phosphatidate cytidylyltransferase [Bacilli bacterium]